MMSIALDRWTAHRLVEITPIPHVDHELATALGGYFEVVTADGSVQTRYGRDIVAMDLDRLLGREVSA